MSDKPEDPDKGVSISRLINYLFWAGLIIAVLLTLMMLVVGALHWLPWKIAFYTLAQVLLGSVMCGAVASFVPPRMSLVFGNTSWVNKITNVIVTLFGIAFIAFLVTLLSTLWPSPEMNFLEGSLSNLGFIGGTAIGLRMYRSQSS
jgi:hypothetical protein